MDDVKYGNNILIPFDLVADSDIGLIRFIGKRFRNDNIFYPGILDMDDKELIWTLRERKNPNPLDIVCNENLDEYDKQIRVFYEEFNKKYRNEIIELSPTTDIANLIEKFIGTNGIVNVQIQCATPAEEDKIKYILKDNPDTSYGIVSGFVGDIDISIYDSIFVKDYRDILKYNEFIGKNIYIGNYGFNFIKDDKEISVLLPDVSAILADVVIPTVIDVYNIDESYVLKG